MISLGRRCAPEQKAVARRLNAALSPALLPGQAPGSLRAACTAPLVRGWPGGALISLGKPRSKLRGMFQYSRKARDVGTSGRPRRLQYKGTPCHDQLTQAFAKLSGELRDKVRFPASGSRNPVFCLRFLADRRADSRNSAWELSGKNAFPLKLVPPPGIEPGLTA